MPLQLALNVKHAREDQNFDTYEHKFGNFSHFDASLIITKLLAREGPDCYRDANEL
jgi:hypothetical protein